MSEMSCTRLDENTGRKNDVKNRHLRTIAQLSRAISSQLRHISTVGKKRAKQQYLLHMPYNMVNFGSLAAEIISLVWDTPSNFNGFRVFASLLQRCRSTEANQTLQLHDVWPSPARLHYIYVAPCRNFVRCKIQFASSKSCAVLLAVLLHGTRAVGASQILRR